MRRIICLLGALLMCLSLACPAYAATGTFVPSISYKDGPEIEDAQMNGENVTGCVVVSSIKAAKDKSTDIYQEDRDLLLEVYQKLKDGSMKLPLDGEDYVIRELVDVSFRKTTCVEAEHGHKEWLAQDDTTITITFDLGVAGTTDVVVMVYLDGQWVAAKSVKNNGDGTITCVFDDICPVAFCIKSDAEDIPPKTGDVIGRNLTVWITVLVISLVAIVVLVIFRRRNKR